MNQLPIIHFNDAYRVGEQKTSNDAGVIDVTQFAYKVDEMRNSWSKRDDGERDGLVLFSGDLFSPSIESGVTRGSHMVSNRDHRIDDRAIPLLFFSFLTLISKGSCHE